MCETYKRWLKNTTNIFPNTYVLLSDFYDRFYILNYNIHETLTFEDSAPLPFYNYPFYIDQKHSRPVLDPIQFPNIWVFIIL